MIKKKKNVSTLTENYYFQKENEKLIQANTFLQAFRRSKLHALNLIFFFFFYSKYAKAKFLTTTEFALLGIASCAGRKYCEILSFSVPCLLMDFAIVYFCQITVHILRLPCIIFFQTKFFFFCAEFILIARNG